MKFLLFKYNDRILYGVKVKCEDVVWDLLMVFVEFGDKDFNFKILIVGL